MIVVIATLHAKSEHADELEADLRGLAQATRSEPGARGYSVLRQPDDRFFVFERYADRAAFDAHFAADHLTGFLARAAALLVGPPTVESGEELAGFAVVNPGNRSSDRFDPGPCA